MTIRFLRRVTTVAGALALVASLVAMVGAAAPASAATPTVSVSPTSINSGDQVTIDLQGFDSTQLLVALVCPASYAASAGTNPTDAGSHCALLTVTSGSSSLQSTVVVNDYNTAFSGGTSFSCSVLPGGCVIAGANTADEVTASNFVSTPITIAPSHYTITAASPANNDASVPVTTTGFPSGQPGTIGECPGNITAATVSSCAPLASYPTGIPASTQVVVHDQYQANGTWSTCGAFQSCALAAWAPDPSPTAFAYIPFTVNGPSLTATPTTVANGQTVTVSASNGLATPGPASIMECPDDPSILTSHVYTTCSAPQAFTVDASGSFSIPFVFHDPIPSADGQARPCASVCGLAVVASNGPFPYFTGITSSTPTIEVLVAGPYYDGQSVSTQLFSFPDGTATVAECAAGSVGADLASSDCTNPQPTTVAGGSASLSYVVHASFAGKSGTVDCTTVSCVLVGFGASGLVAKSPPLMFRLLSLTPSTGLHDGDAIAVSAGGLSPNTPYRLAHCVPGAGSVAARCEKPLPAMVTSDANGNISANVPALQRFTTGAFYSLKTCVTSSCSIAVIDNTGAVQAEQPYTLATPTASASPNTGLHDGDTVTVNGSDLEPTYSAPTLLPSGGWVLLVCGKAMGTKPGLLDVFNDCGVPSGGGPVNVPGTTSSTAVQVPATLTTVAGGTIDCTASPGACVIGLGRWEQDATVTTAFTPLNFS